jgi:hypothetical protein
MECAPKMVYKAVKEFFDIERDMRRPSLKWDEDDLQYDPRQYKPSLTDYACKEEYVRDGLWSMQVCGYEGALTGVPGQIFEVFERVSDRIISEFGPINEMELMPRHGPGVVADLPKGVSKYTFPTWPAKLEAIFPISEFGYANLTAYEEDLLAKGDSYGSKTHEAPSKLIAVPKTQKGPRLIAAEPTAHQWMQQALMRKLDGMIRSSVLGNCVDISNQELSKDDALQASRSGQRATIDLSSASDRLSCCLIERVFRSHRDLLNCFHAARTRWLVNRIDKKLPKYVVLRKFAPMGSSLTFPVQSMVYALAAITAVIYGRGWSVDKRSLTTASRMVRVYGDDIIVPVDVCGILTDLLTEVGLQVNQAKTFSVGNFRESCGMDAFKGVDVTPAYVLEVCDETRPASVVSTVASSNNFFRKGLWRTASWLQSTVPSKFQRGIRVVSAESGAFGWVSYCGSVSAGHKSRWNNDLQRWEIRVLVPRVRVERRPIEGWQSLLQYFTEAPDNDLKDIVLARLNPRDWETGLDSEATVGLSRSWGAA